MAKKIRIQWVRSAIGRKEKQKRNIEALGLHRLHQVVVHNDVPQIRGMIARVSHLVTVEEFEE
jgi:large subunit ribosomal protein L30